MDNKDQAERSTTQQIMQIIDSGKPDEQIREALNDYHENDIADALTELTPEERKKLYGVLGIEKVSKIFTYIEDVSEYLNELSLDQAADVLENMDADDAVDALEDIDNIEKKEKLIDLMDHEASDDIRLISSYSDDEIGSMMTTNFVTVSSSDTIKEAMKSMVSQAKENDNINIIYVVDNQNKYYGAIDLRDLIIARQYEPLNKIISRNYPSIQATETITDTIEDLKDYGEDSIPVLNEADEIIGILTSQDVVEAVDDEMGDDYAKLAGLTAEEDLNETLGDSVKKRMPWLILLLFLGMGVSSVVGMFESVVASIAIIMCFQSLILDMAGNVGTQSLAVTIRVLMDENVSGREKAKFVWKEMQIGGTNGLLLGSMAFLCVGLYLHLFKAYAWAASFQISGCVGLALFLAMIISSFVGTITPIFFHKIKIDPAVASGPLITTINDLVAVVAYYGLAELLLVGRI
ncbi:MAG: magnesium transporter [Eubacteriaceae bacterium]|jgi:magnesium transporter